MERKYEYVTVLMQKIVLNINTYIFRPICIKKGNLDEKIGAFIDEFDHYYYSMFDLENIGPGGEETECFALCYSDEDLMDYFPAETKSECIQLMADYFYDRIWIGYIIEIDQQVQEEEQKIFVVGMPYNEILQKYINISDDQKEIINQKEEKEYILTLDSKTNIISDNEINELLKIRDLSAIKSALISLKEKSINNLNIIKNNGMEFNDSNKEKQSIEKIMTQIKEYNNLDLDQIYKEINIEEMYKYITERVIGQDEAIKQIITTFIMNKIISLENFNEELTRVFLIGPTGSGKTLIIEMMVEYLSKVYNINLPFAKVPTSQLTSAGYVGMNLEDIIKRLVINTTGNFSSDEARVKYAEQNGIVFLDELDKKGSFSNSDIAGRAVLNALLQFLSGATYDIVVGSKLYNFDTKNLTIIASGAFTNIFENNNKLNIGFNSEASCLQSNTMEKIINEGGMPRELMGRFHRIINLNPMTKELLIKILKESKISTLLSYKAKLQKLGVDLIYEGSFINKIADEANKSVFGARSLKSLVDESLDVVFWEALKHKDDVEIKVTDQTVNNPKIYTLKPKKHKSYI